MNTPPCYDCPSPLESVIQTPKSIEDIELSPFRLLLNQAADRLCPYIDSLESAPAKNPSLTTQLREEALKPPGAALGVSTALDKIMSVALSGYESNSPLHMAYVCSGNVAEAAVGELVSLVLNRYVSLRQHGEGMAAMEDGLIRWMVGVMGLPSSAHGILTSGGSMAILSAVVAARERVVGRRSTSMMDRARVYVTDQSHMSLVKAIHFAGLSPSCVVKLDLWRMEEQVRSDVERGHVPMMVFATAGTTSTGLIEPLVSLASLARRHNAWFHVDACYGGFFMLTERGRARLRGIEEADSISLDPHKSLFMPSGSGALLVRDAHAFKHHLSPVRGAYLRDVVVDAFSPWPEFADLGPELTRESRALKLWLPLHVHGIEWYRQLLDDRLDLAAHLASSLAALSMIVTLNLSIVTARLDDPEQTNRLVLRLCASREILFSSTVVGGQAVLRFCVLQWRTSMRDIERVVGVVKEVMRD
ncbi:pyridoxal phosphate-dependent transferase [Kockovaella imperatae]|uniref:Pyridoxal phosphate-dependent transferase n=1 Tax=Kockovaella imperatae TaxID=4999 RepID=A0A1Y1U724_9TREE|nr:pyridoxal phosphate-dependent transferase [Kockovaella imperatae]ORX33307.1 pyridoxal phosphate-dependent transferase [Kockovaella imperatae]